jgi:3-dehydroquinate synthase II
LRKLVWVRADWESPWEEKEPFVRAAIDSGADAVFLAPGDMRRALELGPILVASSEDSPDAGILVLEAKSLEDVKRVTEQSNEIRKGGKKVAALVEVKDKLSEQAAAELGKIVDYLLVTAKDWKIIPLENLIAELQETPKKLLAEVKDSQEALLAAQTLEVGVDGVLLDAREKGVEEIKRTCEVLEQLTREELELQVGRIKDLRPVGIGDRACVDTTSMLKVGEGMLVGSQAEGLFLVHSETLPSEFVEPRPFRVNAGGVHSYLRASGGKTKYLTELKAGDEVLVVDGDGKARCVVVGRVKIERRPLVLVEAEVGDKVFKVLLQHAETINLVGKGGKPIPVTRLKEGNEVLLHIEAGGRHFGKKVKETLIER